MKRLLAALALLCLSFVTPAAAQLVPFPQSLPANSVVGRLGVSAGPAQAIPFSVLSTNLLGVGSGTPGPIIITTPAPFGYSILSTQVFSGALTNLQYFGSKLDIADNADASGTSINGVYGIWLQHTVGGSTVKGGRAGALFQTTLNGATNSANTNRFYTGAQMSAQAATDDGGTGTTPALSKGAFTGANITSATTAAAAVNLNSVVGTEINVAMVAGSSTNAKQAIRIAQISSDVVQGATEDGAIVFVAQSGAVGWKNGLLFSRELSAGAPLSATATLINTDASGGAWTVGSGIDLSAVTVTNAALKSNGSLALSNSGSYAFGGNLLQGDGGFARTASTGAIFLGSNGGQFIFYDGAKFQVGGGGWSAALDSAADLGTSAVRWSTGFINTLTGSGQAARTWSLARNVTAATPGVDWTLQGSGAVSGGTNLAAGNVIITTGNSTGTGGAAGVSPAIILKATRADQQGSGTTDSTPEEVIRFLNGAGGFGLVCLRGTNCSSSTYAITGSVSDSSTYFNASTGGSIKLRVNNADIATMSATVFNMSATTASTSSTTGAITSGGGIGSAGAIWAGTYVSIGAVAVASLPACAAGTEGARASVNNSNAASFTAGIGAVVAAGGTTHVPVYCDGTNWRIG